MALPAPLRKLLAKDEVLVAGHLFEALSQVHASSLTQVSSLLDLSGCPNLQQLLTDNDPLLAYLRFAPRPWRFREFMRMLCPAADGTVPTLGPSSPTSSGTKPRSSG